MSSDLLPSPRIKPKPRSSNNNNNLHYKQLFALVSLLPNLIYALPINGVIHELTDGDNDGPMSVSKHQEPLTEGEYYVYLVTSIALVLLGGVFAGLTLGLMGQDEVYLKVMASSGTPNEQKCAKKVLKLLAKGKHWLLVTLLLGNVITNETLPVILDRFLGGGFVAVFSSTVSIVIFGEIIPQSVCVRYGLQLGAFFAPYVQVLMYIMFPVAYPTAKLLDKILGEDHGTVYKKSGLKTLVTLHKTMGVERLNEDEVTIISAVLDLKAKPVEDIMTPIKKVFTMSSDTILDEQTVEEIFNAGFSRIPVHLPGEPYNFVGMLLVRILISYDPEDALPVSSFPLATLPETSLETSCLNILNYFQEGKSHMVVVSETPGSDTGAKGVLTLEDVIEELIGEEIIDESDVYVDVDKNIVRSNPGPLSKRNVTSYLHSLYTSSAKPPLAKQSSFMSTLPDTLYFNKRDSIDSQNQRDSSLDLRKVSSTTAMKPSNLASSPLQTKNTHVTIKKQPQLVSAKMNPPNSHVAGDITPSSRLVSPEPEFDPGYGSTVHDLHVTDSEAAAFVHGVYKNQAQKISNVDLADPVNLKSKDKIGNGSSKRQNSATDQKLTVDLSDVRPGFGTSIPVPKPVSAVRNSYVESSAYLNSAGASVRSGGVPMSSLNGNSTGLIENIVNIRGVNKTVIEETSSAEYSGIDSDSVKLVKSGSSSKSGKSSKGDKSGNGASAGDGDRETDGFISKKKGSVWDWGSN
ncbi:unnamed protein product [Ambrosiozyma monospora]|uniref:Unnamed protein product n=1 Tax=Ambrosiozyma monospora TaxID=43982 RepID=A0A9W6Z1W5_AMBMO|nr:unnamed protein product [Ambrosiozyma monospora]